MRWVLMSVLLLALFLGGLSYYFLSRSLPSYNTAVTLPDLRGETEIVRDARAVPHIFAKTDYDGFFALGFVHAQDRLWQMEMRRRIARGQMTELIGWMADWAGRREYLLRIDETMRAIDLQGSAERSLAHFSPEARRHLEAYAAGVNAWLGVVNDEALGRGAPELMMLGATVDRWTPADSIAALKLTAMLLSGGIYQELRRARYLVALGPELTADLFPEDQSSAVIGLPREEAVLPFASPERIARALPEDWPLPHDPIAKSGASNAWAISAARSSSNAPLLAADPHLPLSAPSIWYVARVEFPGIGVIGGTIPGIPAVLIGRNASIGWGLTTLAADTQDLFIEKVNPDNPDEYLTPEGWRPFEKRVEPIALGDGTAVEVVLRRTRHGPVLPLSWQRIAEVTPDGHVAAVAATLLSDEDRTLEAVMTMMRAPDVESAQRIAPLVTAPTQNVIIADRNGIAQFAVGAVPLRDTASRLQGRVPVPGWQAENDWVGLMRAPELPAVIDPPSGAVANANNRITDAPFPRHLTHDWPEDWRMRRIRKLLDGRDFHSLAGFQAIQNDTVSEMARTVLPLIAQPLWSRLQSEQEGPRRAALEKFAQWNGDMDAFLAEPLIFVAWMRALVRRLTAEKLGDLAGGYAGIRPQFLMRVFRNEGGAAARWCVLPDEPEPTRDPMETCRKIARRALNDAVGALANRYGEDMSNWRWGRAHQAVHNHVPLGFTPLHVLSNIRHESGGGRDTIKRGLFRGNGPNPYENIHAGGLRVVYDFADLDRSVYAMATGQSGHFFSRHYDDFIEDWRSGEYQPLSLDRSDAEAGSVGITVLRPMLKDPLADLTGQAPQ
ncbi:MAG: penicillin acylase family protein [Neomegalonema sp.]|nr:penicillin acylase family protein [Neomegalonema sp.]